MVVFAHGSGSGRRSPRNRFVADVLATAGLGTLLFDLLTVEEEQVLNEAVEEVANRLIETLVGTTARDDVALVVKRIH